jgi:hypothetical protein
MPKEPKIYYGTQTGVSPPTIMLFVNDPRLFGQAFRRFLENRFREVLPFKEIPLRIVYKRRKSIFGVRHDRSLLLPVPLLLLSLGCGEGKKKGAEARPPLDVTKLLPQAPDDSEPKQGGIFIWGRSGDATLLDPADVTDGESVMVVTNLFDTLVAFKRGSTEIEPSLAKEWTASDDNLVWTFVLRDGARFHDGTR